MERRIEQMFALELEPWIRNREKIHSPFANASFPVADGGQNKIHPHKSRMITCDNIHPLLPMPHSLLPMEAKIKFTHTNHADHP
jgi:hypothetical protein